MNEALPHRSRFLRLLSCSGFFATLLFCLSPLVPSQSVRGQETYPEELAANIGGIGGGPMRAFVDVVKSSNRWARPDGTALDYDTDFDENGWPNRDFRMIAFDWRLWGGWWNPPYDDPERKQIDVSGVYTVSFKGQATISGFAPDTYFDISNQVYDAASNTTTLDLYLWNQAEVLAADANDNSGLLAIQFTNTVNPDSATGAGITELKIIRPGYADRADQTFTDEFLNALSPFSTLRFMDIQSTNNSNPFQGDPYPRNVTLWEDRVTKDSPSQVLTTRGMRQPIVAWEHDIEIANAVGADLWINLPVHAEDEYVKKLAILIAYGVDMSGVDVSGAYDISEGVQTTEPLDPSLNVYLEHSNEVWNFGFTQYTYNKLAAVEEAANGFDWGSSDQEQMARRRHMKRTRDAGLIFASVFEDVYGPGALMTRVRPVHAHWASALNFSFSAIWQQPIDWMEATYGPVSSYFYGFAIAPYMNASGASETATPEELLQKMIENSDTHAAGMRTFFIDKCVNEWGVEPMTYEGGPDTGGGATDNVQNRVLVHRLPGMKDAVKRDLADNWFDLGGGIFNYFVVAGGASRHGAWGATEDVLDLSAPKYQALLELAGDVSLQLLTTSLPDGEVSTEYDVPFTSFGGALPLGWSVEGGSLPAGVTLDAATGRLSGVPASGSEGVYSPLIRVTDDDGDFDEAQFDFQIAAFVDSVPQFTTAAGLPDATEGSPYQLSFAVSGGNGALSWTLPSPADLPAGITFDGGLLSGTPTVSGDFSFDVWVADSDQVTGVSDEARQTFSLHVNDNPNIPGTPTALSLSVVSSSVIDLTWVDNADNETGFEIQISGDGGQNYLQTETVGANVTSFTHADLNPETIYFYRVRAVNGAFVSGFAGPEGAQTLPEEIDPNSVLAAYDFADNVGSEASEAPSYAATGLTVSDLTRGAGLAGSGNTYQNELGGLNVSGTRFDQTDVAGAVSEQDYFEFTVTPEDGYTMNLSTVFYSVYAQNNGTTPENLSIEVQYSLDGFATAGVSIGGNVGVTPQTIGGMLGNPITLTVSDVAELQELTVPVTFRIYGYNGTRYTSRGLGFAVGDDLSISGTISDGSENEAKPYRYLRMWMDGVGSGGGMHLREFHWLSGDNDLPSENLTSNAGNEQVSIFSTTTGATSIWQAFDGDFSTAWYVSIGHEMTLDFGNVPAYPTGVRIECPSWSIPTDMRLEGSNDGTEWDLIAELNDLNTTDHFFESVPNEGVRTATFDFGLTLPDDIPVAPSAPSDLTVDSVTKNQVTISWTDNSDNEVGFEIQVSDDGGATFARSESVAADVSNFTDTGLTPDSEYQYRVRAVGDSLNSSFVGPEIAQTLPDVIAPGTLLAGYDFADNVGSEASEVPSFIASGLTVSDLTRGAGLAGSGNTYQSELGGINVSGTRFDQADLAGAVSQDDYFEFTVTPDDGYSLNLSSVFYSVYAQNNGTSPGNLSIEVLYSLDGFATAGVSVGGNVGVTPQTIGGMLGNPFTLNVSDVAELQGLTGPVTFRVYGYNGTQYTSRGLGFSDGEDLAISGTLVDNSQTMAKPYRYLRLWMDGVASGGGMHLREFHWLSGENDLPSENLMSNAGNEQVSIFSTTTSASSIWQIFDGDFSTAWYVGVGHEMTLDFGNVPAYPTGVRIECPSWSTPTDIRLEGSNDNLEWDLLGEFNDLNTTEHFNEGVPGEGVRTATFQFGLTLPDEIPVAPLKPSDLAVDSVTTSEVNLSWTDNSDDETGFEIQVSDDGGATFGRSESVAADVSTFTDTALAEGTEYQYRVRAKGVDIDSYFTDSVSATTSTTVETGGEAEPFRYLRFWIDETSSGSQVQLRELRWMFGEQTVPFTLISQSEGDESVAISTTTGNLYAFDGPWKMFDGDYGSHWYVTAGNEVTLDFGELLVYPTGIRLESPSWSYVAAFHAEASNDGETWTLLGSFSDLTANTNYPNSVGGVRSGTFDFGLSLPDDFDLDPPSVPANLSQDEVLDIQATISWDPSTDDGVGLSRYNLYVDGAFWRSVPTTSVNAYALSPNTEYTLRVSATDLYGNESELSEPLVIQTQAMLESISPMTMGMGLGSGMSGVWKSGVNYAQEWANYETSNPFSQQFLDELAHNKVLRFMDWLTTNNNWVESWDERRLPDDSSQAPNPNWNRDNIRIATGVAIEWQIKLCNLVGADYWVNIPHAANDDYIAQLAALVYQHLDPELNVWVEYSNEVWAGFAAEFYANDRGFELGLDQGDFPRYDWFEDDEYARFRYTVYRSLQIHKAFDDAFGSDSDRVVKVLSGWYSQVGVSKVHRDALTDTAVNPEGRSIDVYAVAPYFNWSPGSTEDETLLHAYQHVDQTTTSRAQAHYDVWSQEGIPLVTYEGGQHITTAGESLSRQTMMYNAYNYYLNALAPFFSEFTHFVHSGGYSRGSAWGSKEYIGQPDHLAFKYRALKDWTLVNENVEEVLLPIITNEPQDATAGEGAGASFSVSVLGAPPFAFQWYLDGQPIAGANGPVYDVEEQLEPSDSGRLYHVEISNGYGTVVSETATLTVSEIVGKAFIEQAQSAIAIDGVMEAAWDVANEYTIATVNNGSIEGGTTDLSGYYRALWDDIGVYVFVRMYDDVLVTDDTGTNTNGHLFDSVEVYFDWDNLKGTSYSNDAQYRYRWNDGMTAASGNPSLVGVLAESVTLDDGYTVEFFFPWSVSGDTPFSNGRYLGFDVMANDNDELGSAIRQGKLAWWADTDRAWTDPSTMGTAYLVEAAELMGDLDGNGTIDSTDMQIMRSQIGKRSGDAGYNAAADLDNDGVVSRADYAIWYQIARESL